MKKYCLDLTVKAVEHINEKYVLIKLTLDSTGSPTKVSLPEMQPGQFVEVRVDDSPTTFLRRPISINNVDYSLNELHLLVAAIGDGTRRLARLNPGEKLNVMLPLGNGFTMPASPEKKHLLCGGGVGVAPLLYLGRKIKEMGAPVTFLLGARSAKDLLMLDAFKTVGRVFVTTEDGSQPDAGLVEGCEKGFVTNHSLLNEEQFDMISVCGPKPMMVAVARYAEKVQTECEVSLENKMACGLGACLCCVEKTNDKGNICICTEGPVINTKRLDWTK